MVLDTLRKYLPNYSSKYPKGFQMILEAFSEASGNTMYLGIGRPQPFSTSTRGDARTNNEGSDI